MQALGNDAAIYERLVASLAPSIWQMDDVKKGILCQLFGGCGKVPARGTMRLTPGIFQRQTLRRSFSEAAAAACVHINAQ